MDTEFVTVARVWELPASGGLNVAFQGRQIAIFKTAHGLFAIDALCPHRGGPLSAGWVEDAKVFCPIHGWEFDLRTGACRTSPERPVRCFQVRIQGSDVQVAAAPPAGETP